MKPLNFVPLAVRGEPVRCIGEEHCRTLFECEGHLARVSGVTGYIHTGKLLIPFVTHEHVARFFYLGIVYREDGTPYLDPEAQLGVRKLLKMAESDPYVEHMLVQFVHGCISSHEWMKNFLLRTHAISYSWQNTERVAGDVVRSLLEIHKSHCESTSKPYDFVDSANSALRH